MQRGTKGTIYSRRMGIIIRCAAMNSRDAQSDRPMEDWIVFRIDDNGNVFTVRTELSRDEAERLVAEFEARGHKQMYWAEVKSS